MIVIVTAARLSAVTPRAVIEPTSAGGPGQAPARDRDDDDDDEQRRDGCDPPHGPDGTELVEQPGTAWGAEPSGVGWTAAPGQRLRAVCRPA